MANTSWQKFPQNFDWLLLLNWKMEKTHNEAVAWLGEYSTPLDALAKKSSVKLVLFPSFESIQAARLLVDSTDIAIGAQACSPHAKGAFTGQVSVFSLAGLGCTYCLVGHKEERLAVRQTERDRAKKMRLLIEAHITPVLCVGEPLSHRASAFSFVEQQIAPMIEVLSTLLPVTVVIAYEPWWAIGTKAAPAEHIAKVCQQLHDYLSAHLPRAPFNILYGGSLETSSISVLKQIPYLSGFLVGHAGLALKSIKEIIEALSKNC